MDRIHRLGQHRPVKAIKLVVEDSIESRIVQVSLTFRYRYVRRLTSFLSSATREEICNGRRDSEPRRLCKMILTRS